MSDQLTRLHAEIQKQEKLIAKLEANVKYYDDEKAAYSLLYLSMTGSGGGMPDIEGVRLFAPVIGPLANPHFGRITLNAGAAKSGATGASKRHKKSRVIEFRIVPVQLIEKENGKKWPKKKNPKKKI